MNDRLASQESNAKIGGAYKHRPLHTVICTTCGALLDSYWYSHVLHRWRVMERTPCAHVSRVDVARFRMAGWEHRDELGLPLVVRTSRPQSGAESKRAGAAATERLRSTNTPSKPGAHGLNSYVAKRPI